MAQHSQPGSSSASDLRAAGAKAEGASPEQHVRALVEAGDYRSALDAAKELHKLRRDAASEALLVDVYIERIRALTRRSLDVEARSLVELVRQRYPSARRRLSELSGAAQPRHPSIDELLSRLADPASSATERETLERTLEQEVWDLEALARCDALPADHPLRRSAAALHRVFVAVTSGPVDDDLLALPEVSRRSPLAPWKLLVRAIALFYRGEDEACEQCLALMPLDSAPARAVPPLRALLCGDGAAPLSPAGAALRTMVGARAAALRSALDALDRAFADQQPGRILEAVRAAVDECRRSAPVALDAVRQHISVRCAMAHLEPSRVAAAMGGGSRHDAVFLRLLARGFEDTRDAEDLLLACRTWDEFRHAAAREGWFAANGAESAAVSLRIAELLERLPETALRDIQRSARADAKADRAAGSYLFPGELYERACLLDPDPDALGRWMTWAKRQPGNETARVASIWRKLRPHDREPLAQLASDAESKGNWPTALGYVDELARLDSLYPGIQQTKRRLLVRSAFQHLAQRKPKPLAAVLDRIASLPQAEEGIGPAVLAALRALASHVRGEPEQVEALRRETERLLDSCAAAAMLLFWMAVASRRDGAAWLGPVTGLPRAARAGLPSALAQVGAVAAEIGVPIVLPRAWINEVAKRFSSSRTGFDVAQLRSLAGAALHSGHPTLAYAVASEGLTRGAADAAAFLLVRARAVPADDRRAVCAAAARALALAHHDGPLAAEAGQLVKASLVADLTLTVEQAHEVVRTERRQSQPSRRVAGGPDYRHLLPLCQCPTCRAERGEPLDPFFADLDDEDEFEDDPFDLDDPLDIDSNSMAAILEAASEAHARGESFESFAAKMLGVRPPGGRRGPRKKRKRR